MDGGSGISIGYLVAFAASGLLMGLLGCFVGIKQKVEATLWTLLYAGMTAVAAWQGIGAPFRTILIAGGVAGVLTATLTMLCFDRYKQKNPWYAKQLEKPKSQLAGSYFGMGIGMGLLFGAIFGGIAWWLAR